MDQAIHLYNSRIFKERARKSWEPTYSPAIWNRKYQLLTATQFSYLLLWHVQKNQSGRVGVKCTAV